MLNIIKIPKIYKKILILFVLFLLLFVNQSSIFAASGTSCYIPIPNKPGCSGLNTINDVKHKGQLKCFTIDKKAKDCGVFVNVLPTDTSQGLDTGLDILNCTGSNKNTPECASYCYNNPNTSPSECIDCNSLTPSEKASYSYCQDEESAKWCDFIASDGNGTGWPKTLAGVENAIGTCLDGYEIDVETGAPRRNCLEGGIWSSPSVLCISAKCHAIQETAGKTYANGYAIWPETNKNTSNIQGTCVQDYKQASAGLNPSRSCNNKGQWQEVNNHCIPITCPTLYDAANNVQWNEAIPGSNSSVQAGGVCDVGYEAASGQYPIRLCNRNGTWGDVVVECVIKQCNNTELNTLNPLSNSEYNYSSLGISPTGKSSYGITLIGNCSTGYEKSNPGSTISATCNSNGEWNFIPSSDNGLCQIKTCSISSATSTANISNISSSAAWTLCSDSSCSSTSTTYASSSSTTLNYGSYIKFNACNTGYSTTGSTILQCTETNTWSVVGVNNGACIVQCTWSALNTLTYSSPELSSSKLIETANTWYNADGNNITKPTSSTTYYNSGTVYQIGCPTGYAEITKKKITCNTGTWSTTTADVCSPNACSTATLEAYKTANLPALANITIVAGDTIASGANKSYTCNAGYSGSIVLSCSAGSVTGYTGSCTPTCTGSSLASAISNASQTNWYICPVNNTSCTSGGAVSVAGTIYSENTFAYLNSCATGYTKSTTAIYKCTASNTWAVQTAATCNPSQCNNTSLPASLNSTNFTNLIGTTTPANVSWYTAASGGTVVNITTGTTNSGTSIYATCPTGYSTTSRLAMSCSLGNWSMGAAGVCSANPCSTATLEAYKTANLPALANITIVAGDTIASGANKSYTCNAGYSGSIVLSCSAGSVTGYTGSCAMQTCTISSATSMAAISNMSSSSSAWTLCSDSSCLSTSTVYPASSSTALNYGSYIKFNACNTGYVKGGSTILQCTGINTWSFVGASTGVCNITCTKTALNSKVSSVAGSVLYQANPLFGMYGTSYRSDMSIDISHTGSQSNCNYNDKSNSQYFANATFIEATCNGNYLETGNTVSGISDYSGNQRPIPLTTPNTGHHYYCENGSWKTVGGCVLRCPTFDSSPYNGTFTATNGACSDGTSSDLCPGATRTLNSCNSGYVKDGNLVITCNSSGAWVASGGGFCGRNCVNASLATGSMFVRVTATDYCPEPDISLTETVYSQGTASADHGQYGYSAMLRNLVRANGSQPGEGFACFVDFQVRALCYNGSFTGFCLSYKSAVAVYESGSCGGNCSNSWPSGGYCN